VGWCLKYWRDVQADLRAFFHLTPAQALALPGPELLVLIYRCPFFPGVLAARYAKEQEEERRQSGAGPGRSVIPASREGVELAGLSEYFEIE
jgi:hypothetical protein